MKTYYQLKIFSIVSLLFLLFGLPYFASSQDLFSNFNENQLSSNQLKIFTRLQNDSSTIDLHVVKINTSLFRASNSLNINLSPDKNLSVLKKKLYERDNFDFTWSATIPEKPIDIMFSVYKDAVVGYMVIENQCYNIHYLGDGLNAIVHADPRKYPRCGNSPYSDNSEQNCTTCDSSFETHVMNSNKSTKKIEKSLTTNAIIRLLVVYTDGAKSAIGGVNAMNALINASIITANEAFENSEVYIELELAHKYEVNYDESGNENSFNEKWCDYPVDRLETLEQFQDPNDGNMDEIHGLRDAYAADICVLITTSVINDYGQTYQIHGDEDEAFIIVRYDHANDAGGWSFTHEIGHILGGRHQDDLYGREGADWCNEPYDYAHGYAFQGNDLNDYRTMMHVDENWGDRIKYFANPTVEYQGTDTGDEGHYVASVLNQRRTTVSNFRMHHSISENLTLTEDLEIKAGRTLTISPDLTVSCAPGVELIIKGTLNEQGNGSNPITFTRDGTSGYWGGIWFEGGSLSGDIFDHNVIQYANYGFKFSSGSSGTIQNCDIIHNNWGIYLYNAGAIYIEENDINNNTQSGITSYYGTVYIQDNPSISNPDADGLQFQNTSPDVYGNVITGNYRGVSTSGSTVDMGASCSNGGYNSVYNNSNYELFEGDGLMYIHNNWWGYPGIPWYDFYQGGTILGWCYLYSDPNLGKQFATHNSSTSVAPELEKLMDAIEIRKKGDYDQAFKMMDALLADYYSSPNAPYILMEIHKTFVLAKNHGVKLSYDGDVISYLSETSKKYSPESKTPNQEVYLKANQLWASELIRDNKWTSAKEKLEQIKNEFPNSSAEEEALYDLCIVNKESDDINTARQACSELETKYPESEYIVHSKLALGDSVPTDLLKRSWEEPEKEKKAPSSKIPLDFALRQNYPNPFNSMTTFQYELPEASYVNISIYNLKGQKVAQLVEEQQESGYYSIKWDATNQPSGMYICMMNTDEFYFSQKLILLK